MLFHFSYLAFFCQFPICFRYPPLLMLQPHLGQSLIRYRLTRTAGAKHKAQQNGYAGFMFPWESAGSGEEVQGTPYNNVGPWGMYEQHITSDIALAAWQYWKMTNDNDFLASDIEPLLREIANFWASRVVKAADDGLYHIYQVMGPDGTNPCSDPFANAQEFAV